MTPRFPTRDGLRAAGFRGLRVVGDVHGEAVAFAAAIAGAAESRLFVVQLGDLTDRGPDSPDVLRRMFALLDAGRGLFILGNHDHKLRRALLGRAVSTEASGLALTLDQLAAAPDGRELSARAIEEISRAPAWLRMGDWGFVHGAWLQAMAHTPPPPDAGARKPDALLSRALFGEATGRRNADGTPERLLDWVDRLPPGFRVWVGHDRRSTDDRPHVLHGRRGGTATFLDTGAGKGGPLAWIDLSFTCD